MGRFAILRHDGFKHSSRQNHWDFMLETDAGLATWSLNALPEPWKFALDAVAGDQSLPVHGPMRVSAHQLEVHRIAYLDYEGPLSNDRGSVRRCDRGLYRTLFKDDDVWAFVLQGTYLLGGGRLARGAEGEWFLEIDAASNR